MKIYKLFIIAIIAIFFSINIAAAPPQNALQVKIPKADMQRLINIIANIQHYYVESVDTNKLFKYAISGMVSKLDPHSAYLDTKDLDNLDIVTSGKFDGIGITVTANKGALKVITPLDGSPAKKAGVQAGDLIVRINDTLIKDMPINKAITLMRGRRGTKVTLYAIRKNKLKKFVITRAAINVPTVKERLFEQHYGYLRIALFHEPTEKAVKKAVKKLKRQSKGQLYGLIIDLRNNPGGMLNPSIKTADMFLDSKKLKSNKLIVYIKGRTTRRQNFKASGGELLPGTPIVVLINAGSASAAEIVAGALQDHNRAILLGTRSFGKGSVQRVFMVDKTHAVKLTIALYYTPSGKSIQAKGISPDVVIPQLKIQKTKNDAALFDPLYEADLQNHLKNGDTKTVLKRQKLESGLMHQDFQLYEALNVLKGLSAIQKWGVNYGNV